MDRRRRQVGASQSALQLVCTTLSLHKYERQTLLGQTKNQDGYEGWLQPNITTSKEDGESDATNGPLSRQGLSYTGDQKCLTR